MGNARSGRKPRPGRVEQYEMPIQPIVLKQLTVECNVPQARYAELTGLARPSINLTLNRGYLPLTRPDFKGLIEGYVRTNDEMVAWLSERGLKLDDIWKPAEEARRFARPRSSKAMIPVDPGNNEEVEQMRKLRIPEQTLKYFKLFRDPFLDDPRSEKEVYRSADHRYLEYAMYDAATNSGLLAVIAEVGAGKTVMRREVIERLRGDEHVRVVYPQIIDRARVSAASICDAIVMDLSSEKTKQKLEDKSRHVRRLLIDRFSQGKRVCLIIEEAHRLTVPALKHLKVFHELEEGRNKLLSIILLGQTELAELLDEEHYPELRELSRRIQIASIPGLGENTWDYLALKYKIVGGDIEKVITREAVNALVGRLAGNGAEGRKVSQAYPLTVNNYMAKAMILAHEMGEPLVSVDVVNAL